jgi:hypothetical protein
VVLVSIECVEGRLGGGRKGWTTRVSTPFFLQAQVFVFLTGFKRAVPFTDKPALVAAACNSGGVYACMHLSHIVLWWKPFTWTRHLRQLQTFACDSNWRHLRRLQTFACDSNLEAFATTSDLCM